MKSKCKCGKVFYTPVRNSIRIYSKCEDCRKPKKIKGKTGEAELFLEIWNERPHVSELTGKKLLPLGHKLWFSQFLHVLSKGTYSELRLCKENIMLALPNEHEKQETYPKFIAKRDEMHYKLSHNYLDLN